MHKPGKTADVEGLDLGAQRKRKCLPPGVLTQGQV